MRAYIFVPCIVCTSYVPRGTYTLVSSIKVPANLTTLVDGKGEGFGNPISIQTAAIIKAAKAIGGMRRVDDGRPVFSRSVEKMLALHTVSTNSIPDVASMPPHRQHELVSSASAVHSST